MPVVHAPETGYSKEMRSWNAHHTAFGPPGRPYEFQPFPTRMYKATRQKDGSRTFESHDAHDANEQRNFESRGFVAGGQQAALTALEASELDVAKLAAEINYDAQHKLSDRARAEVAEAQHAAGARHLAEIPETPKNRGGRPRKKAELVKEG